MPAIWAKARQGQMHPFIKLEFFRHDFKRFRALFFTFSAVLTGDNLIHDIFCDVCDMVRNVFVFYINFVISGLSIFPRISLFLRFFFGKRKIFLRDCFIVSKR